MKKVKLTVFILVALLLVFNVVGIASASDKQQLTKLEKVDEFNNVIKDKNGDEWNETTEVYKAKFKLPESDVNASGVTLDVTVKAIVGTNSTKTKMYYYGKTSANLPVVSTMNLSLQYRSPVLYSYITEAFAPPYIGAGTEMTTPIYTYNSSGWGYWRARNSYSITTAGLTKPITGIVYSNPLYIEQ